MGYLNRILVYSHKDPCVKPFLEKISRYIQEPEAMGMPYWVFVKNSDPLGVVAVGREPVRLLAPPGTPMAIISLIDPKQPGETIVSFIKESLRLSAGENVQYALTRLSSTEVEALNLLKRCGFEDFDDCYQMVCSLNESLKPSGELRFRVVKREEARQYLSIAENFLQGSPDIQITETLKHLAGLPEQFLDLYNSRENFYYAFDGEQTVGILSLNLRNGVVSNVAVDPKLRGRGYGRQVMLFALEQLRRNGCQQAYLRVHVGNIPAFRLYESLGFIVAERYATLIWRRKNKGSFKTGASLLSK